MVGATASVTPRSTEDSPTANASVAVLLADTESRVAVDVEAVLEIAVPTPTLEDRVAGTVRVTVCPLAMLAQLQATDVVVGAGTQVEMPAGTETTVTVPNVTFAGAVSLSVTLVAALGPLFRTVIV